MKVPPLSGLQRPAPVDRDSASGSLSRHRFKAPPEERNQGQTRHSRCTQEPPPHTGEREAPGQTVDHAKEPSGDLTELRSCAPPEGRNRGQTRHSRCTQEPPPHPGERVVPRQTGDPPRALWCIPQPSRKGASDRLGPRTGPSGVQPFRLVGLIGPREPPRGSQDQPRRAAAFQSPHRDRGDPVTIPVGSRHPEPSGIPTSPSRSQGREAQASRGPPKGETRTSRGEPLPSRHPDGKREDPGPAAASCCLPGKSLTPSGPTRSRPVGPIVQASNDQTQGATQGVSGDPVGIGRTRCRPPASRGEPLPPRDTHQEARKPRTSRSELLPSREISSSPYSALPPSATSRAPYTARPREEL
ncbi:basic salivary proline-rich protein 1-like [Archocentrus centrarchus]|uniref:basic salivary proline-rich protein 1-like n=1 Tax=Archocentrus centrarchus TaxID=63155 RepID=UPI0011EA0A99|nr:basic salivary proline-rich protein 1-like [Archocentrus centrarchus]